MDPKISFRASAWKCKIFWCCRFLTFTCFPPRIFWHVFEKKSHPRLGGNCVRILMDPLLTTNGTALDKINFPHTHDFWPLVAIHKCGLMIHRRLAHPVVHQMWLHPDYHQWATGGPPDVATSSGPPDVALEVGTQMLACGCNADADIKIFHSRQFFDRM